MAPKDKAEQLVNEYRILLINEDTDNEILCTTIAKECALVAVDVMLNFQENLIITEGSIAYKYWQSVKHEINNYANRI
jgi:hypothetical protein